MSTFCLLSDLHTEFAPYTDPFPIDADYLLLAGDVATARSFHHCIFFERASKHFKKVFFVSGNHEYYHGGFLDNLAPNFPNIYRLENTFHELDDCIVLGATLWSSFNDGDPVSMGVCRRSLNDFNLIRNISPSAVYARHLHSVEWLRSILHTSTSTSTSTSKPFVVVTHHAPSRLSIHPRFSQDYHLNGAFASNLEHLVLSTHTWVHGHMHDSCTYKIGNTNIHCNPRGYAPDDLNPKFDPNLVITI